jgi:hypothetical protein
MNLSLLCCKRYDLEDRRGLSGTIFVRDAFGVNVISYGLMCEAIDRDIQNSCDVICVMNWIEKVEAGQLDLAGVDGNGWVINITRDKVWFEGLYSQGEGGEVSLSQFKLALETYLQFLNDPERKTVEVEFPEN